VIYPLTALPDLVTEVRLLLRRTPRLSFLPLPAPMPMRLQLSDLTMCARAVGANACPIRPAHVQLQRRSRDERPDHYRFPDETTAQKAWEELVRLERDYLVDLDDAANISDSGHPP
jgi:hypothetical protein